MSHIETTPHQYCVQVGDRGRLVFPAELRRELGIKDGDRFVLRVEPDGSFRLISLREQARRARGLFKDLAPGRSLSEELIAERRQEAANE